MTEVCSKCGRLILKSDWSCCPHGGADGAPNVITDDIPGGQVIEHLGHEPMTFYSKKAIIAEADRRGLRLSDRWIPGDRQLTNWAAGVDAQTLANAAELVTRGVQHKATNIGQLDTVQFSIRELKTLEGV